MIKLDTTAAQALVRVGPGTLLAQRVARLACAPGGRVHAYRAGADTLSCGCNLKVSARVAVKGRRPVAARLGCRALRCAGQTLAVGDVGRRRASRNARAFKADTTARVALRWAGAGTALDTLLVAVEATVVGRAVRKVRTAGQRTYWKETDAKVDSEVELGGSAVE